MGLDELKDIDGAVFYSANFGNQEPRRPLLAAQPVGTTVLITDTNAPAEIEGWDIVCRVHWTHLAGTSRRAARRLKLSPQELFPRADWSIWFDSSHMPIVDLGVLYRYIAKSPIACFRHPSRTTVAEEAQACLKDELDTPEAIEGWLAWLARVGFPDSMGLYGTACVIRNHEPLTASLDSLWMWALRRWSQRDQLSLPWALWTLGVAPACLQGAPRALTYVAGEPHRPNPYFSVTLWD